MEIPLLSVIMIYWKKYTEGEVLMSEKILVVDDEKEITDLITLYLQNENYTVYPFYDSEKAWERQKTKNWTWRF